MRKKKTKQEKYMKDELRERESERERERICEGGGMSEKVCLRIQIRGRVGGGFFCLF